MTVSAPHLLPWLTREDVARFEQRSERWVKMHAEDLGRVDGPMGSKGKPIPQYPVSGMSPGAQSRYWRSREAEAPPPEPVEESVGPCDVLFCGGVSAEGLSEAQRQEAERRMMAILPIVEAKRSARSALIDVRAAELGVSRRTVYNWVERWNGKADIERRGLTALAGKQRVDKGRSRVLNEAAKDLIVRLMTPDEDCGALNRRQAYEAYEEERLLRDSLGDRPPDEFTAKRLSRYLNSRGRLEASARLPRISYSTFLSWANRIPQSYMVLARQGRDAFDKTEVPVSHRDYSKIAPMDYVVMDHRELDLFCLLPDGQRKSGVRLGRPWVTAALDMRTRKWLGWRIVAQPDSNSIGSVLKSVLRDYGRPREFYWDNGGDFECKWIAGVLAELGSKVVHALPYNARAKSIEPNFKRLAAFERTLPTWCGHKPGARPERLAAMVKTFERWERGDAEAQPFDTLDEIAALYAKVLIDLNAKPHSGVGMRQATETGWRLLSPDEAWRDLTANVVLERVSWKSLKFMFRKRRRVKVRQSRIKMSFHGEVYYYDPSPEYDSMVLADLNGREVEVAIDHLDLHAIAVFHEDRLVCVAEQIELRGMREDDFKADMQQRRRMLRLNREMRTAVLDSFGVEDPIRRMDRRVEAIQKREAEHPQETKQREVALLYPEAERAAQAVAGGGGLRARPVATLPGPSLPEDGSDEFDFFSKE